MKKSTPISVTLTHVGDVDHVVYKGPFSEEARHQLVPLLSQLKDKVVFNFRDLAYIDSQGVRFWMLFFKEVTEGRDVSLEECPAELVDHFCMIPQFVKGMKVLSFYLRYYCDSCRTYIYKSFDSTETMTRANMADALRYPCDQCKKDAHLDAEESVFEFLPEE